MAPDVYEDDDDISLTSTAPSDQLEEYEVETILAQRSINGVEKYLVRWEGYPEERCTWEPEESFCDPLTLQEWGEKNAAISRGEIPEFDVKSLEDRIYAMEQASLERQGRRKAKRFRLGLLKSPAEKDKGEPEEEYELDSLFGSIDGNELSGSNKKQEDRTITSNPKTAGTKSSTDAQGQKQSNSMSKDPRQEKSFATPSYRIPKRPLAKRTTLPPVVGISARAPNDPSKARQRKEHNFDPTDPARAKVFRNLSTKRRHEKISQREPTPDISKLDLRKPGDWLTSGTGPTVPLQSGIWNYNDSSDSLFVEQDAPTPATVEESSTISVSATMFNRKPPEGPRRQMSLDGRSATDKPQLRTGGGPPIGPQRTGSLDSSNPNPFSQRGGEKPQFVQRPPQSHQAMGKTAGRRYIGRGRFLYPGEVMVTIRFGAEGREVGQVRLCNLDQGTRGQLLDTREGNNIDVWFREACTMEQYSLLCEKQGYGNVKYSNGWAIGYTDTAFALNEFTKLLLESNQAALWYHPQSMNANVLVAYPNGSSTWNFLDRDVRYPEDITLTLKIVTRSVLPPISSLPPLPLRRPFPPPVSSHPASPMGPAAMSEQATGNLMQSEDFIMPDAPVEDPKVLEITAEARDGDIAKVFLKHFEFTYNELAEMNTFNKKDRHAHAFYLKFPDHVQAEFDLMALFLKRNKTVIYSSRNEDDWEKFSKTVRNGTVLFHREFREYETMPGLNHLLRNALQQINVFNISLSKPITGTADRDHIERLFPHGGVILLTEDFIRHETDKSILITGWFREFLSRKQPGSWKLYLRPDIQGWLLKMAEGPEGDKMFQIWRNIRDLIPDYPLGHHNFDRGSDEAHSLDGDSDAEGNYHPIVSASHLPNYGSRDENEHPSIPKGLTQEERDTDHLVECYAGWCWLNAHRFRRFIVLTSLKPQKRWLEWHHINIMRVEDYIKEFNVRDPEEIRISRAKEKAERMSSTAAKPSHPAPST